MLGELLELTVSILMHVLEFMGVFIIFFTALKLFTRYILGFFNTSHDIIKVELAKALALGLEFLLAGEILKSLIVRTLDELIILASIMGLRIILTFVIHWETKENEEHCDSIVNTKEEDYKKTTVKKSLLNKNNHKK